MGGRGLRCLSVSVWVQFSPPSQDERCFVVVQVSVFICENNYFRDSVSLSVWNLLLVSFGEYVKPILLPQCYDIGYSLNCLKITQNYCTSVFFYLTTAYDLMASGC